MSASPRLGLSYLAAGQAQKHVTVNESLRVLDALVQLSVLSRSVDNQPSSPQEGDVYILTDTALGSDWAGLAEGQLAIFQDGAWQAIVPGEGWIAFVQDEGILSVFQGTGWTGLTVSTLSSLGINTPTDPVNKLAVKSDAELLSHDDITPGSGDARKIINRAATDKTASVVFQTAFSGQAEFGLTGDSDFRLKISEDGSTFSDAIRVATDTGNVVVGNGDPSAKFVVVGDNVTDSSLSDFLLIKEGFAGFQTFETYGDTSWYAPFFQFRRARGTMAAPSGVLAGDILAGFPIMGANTAGDFLQTARIRCLAESDATATTVPCYLEFATGTTSAAERMRITSDGRMGIGKVSPTAKLDVNGAMRCGSYTVSGLPSAAGNGAGAIIYISDESGGATLAFSDGTNWRRVTDRAVIS